MSLAKTRVHIFAETNSGEEKRYKIMVNNIWFFYLRRTVPTGSTIWRCRAPSRGLPSFSTPSTPPAGPGWEPSKRSCPAWKGRGTTWRQGWTKEWIVHHGTDSTFGSSKWSYFEHYQYSLKHWAYPTCAEAEPEVLQWPPHGLLSGLVCRVWEPRVL